MKYRRLLWILFSLNLLFISWLIYENVNKNIPETIKVIAGQRAEINLNIPAKGSLRNHQTVRLNHPFSIKSSRIGKYKMEVKLFGLFSLKKIRLEVVQNKKVSPGGQPIGIYVETNGVLVLGVGEINQEESPAKNIVQAGDYIYRINGLRIHYKAELMDYIQKYGQKPVILWLRRNENVVKVKVSPKKEKNSGNYKMGIWVRDDTQGIGTLTYTKEKTFAALGHGISDLDTDALIETNRGNIYKANVLSIVKGKKKEPGEILGSIDYADKNQLGNITKNTPFGIFGTMQKALLSENKALPIGLKQDIKQGKAYIQSYISGKKEQYEIEIIETNVATLDKTKGIVIRITDPNLLKKTGGIIQGMSGSPIIQNGKLIGAVTHVFVNDPTKGYGVFAETMIEQE